MLAIMDQCVHMLMVPVDGEGASEGRYVRVRLQMNDQLVRRWCGLGLRDACM